jgi:hypothetical protein
MNTKGKRGIDSPIGKQTADFSGSPVGVVRMDPDKSYIGVSELLQDYINNSNTAAWEKIKKKIDYIYANLDLALGPLAEETDLQNKIKSRLDKSLKLLFKPNLVIATNIDPQTHGAGLGSTACTEWPFIAALMRWFREKLGVSYHRMSIGEAATATTAIAKQYTLLNPDQKTITPEAVMEGKSDNFYGGWGFYFVRKYLMENLDKDASDDPMKGYAESVAGTYIPPGQVQDKLMVYDLNRIFDEPSKGRDVEVPDGVNFKSITLHKVIVGGDPQDPEDLSAYPGCVLINVPKFKVHAITLFTNIIKNLGIGLYPMQSTKTGGHNWDYSVPHNHAPGMKGGIPHEVWVPEIDHNTSIPKRDASENYIVHKTGGINATMIDIIKAVESQNIFMMHIVDGIEAINLDHTGSGVGIKEPEGMVFAGLDPLAADLLCARYMFSNVPIKEALQSGMDDGHGGRFPQQVPVPKLDDGNIITEMGYDCPLSRDNCFNEAEKRGIGNRKYYAIGHDRITDLPVISIQGHLGTIDNDRFSDIVTRTLFWDVYKLPWDMQKTAYGYMDAVDQMEGLTIKKDFLEAFDEDSDGIVTYNEFGKKGVWGHILFSGGQGLSLLASEPMGYLKSGFSRKDTFKFSDKSMNHDGHDVSKEFFLSSVSVAAYLMSQLEDEMPDPFQPGLTCGKGKWPSFKFARFFQIGSLLYGGEYPNRIIFPSLYGSAFAYADITQNQGRYVGEIRSELNIDAVDRYISDVSENVENQLDFIFYVPDGYDTLAGTKLPNVEVMSDPSKILTASFNGGKEIWH